MRDKTLVIGPAPTGAWTGWTEAIQNIPQEALDRDYEELQAFREMPEDWDAHGWQWSEGSRGGDVCGVSRVQARACVRVMSRAAG